MIRVDALARNGVGHAIRQLALAEELVGRGHEVSLLGASDVPWALSQIDAHGLALIPAADPTGFAAQVTDIGGDVVMIDGYEFSNEVGTTLLAAGIPVATMVDGDFGTHQVASLYIDQNLHAVRPQGIADTAQFLGGLDYVLLRDQIRDRRGLVQADLTPPRVLVVFGGTDAFGGAGVAVPMLLDTGAPQHIVAVAATEKLADELRSIRTGDGQTLEVVGPVDDLGALATTCQAAVIAAGTTVWEFLCLGLPTALVCVTDNQLVGYAEASRTLVSGSPVCVPVGLLSALRAEPTARAEGVAGLRRLVEDAALRRVLAGTSRVLVDGEGRGRVADGLERLAAQA